MRVSSISLTDFALVKESGISHMEVKFSEDVQVIIGTNGAGKSSFLRQLSSTPTIRSLFGKKGFKSVTYERNGVSYRLESEYEKPSSPHAFYEGDNPENLNVGRTTDVQKELIAEHLGITPLVDDLIMNRYIFPKWTPSKRKEFLMGANPDQIGFVLDHIRMVASKIKACKNVLARLQSRKILLEQDLLNEETLAVLREEKATIDTELGHFQQNLMDIEVGLRTVGETSSQVTLLDLPAIRKTIVRCRNKLDSLSHVSRDDHTRQALREQLLQDLAVLDRRRVEADEEILRVSEELADQETRYREISPDGDLKSLDDNISRLEAERDRFLITRPQFEISQEELDKRYRELDELRDRLQIFNNLSIRLISSKKRQRRERLLSNVQYRISSIQMTLGDLRGQYEDLSKRHKLSPEDIPSSPCAKDACPLYSHFFSRFQETEIQRQAVSCKIASLERRLQRLSSYESAVNTFFRESRSYYDQIQWLVSAAQSNGVLHHVLRQLDILSVLQSTPTRISRRLQDEYEHIAQWLRLKSIQSDLETAYALKSRHISSESHDVIKLVSSIENNKKALYELRSSITEAFSQMKRLEQELSDIKTFSEVKSTILSIQTRHMEMLQVMANSHEKDLLTFLRKGVEELRSKHFMRLSEIDNTLRSQTSLRDRYQEEVVSQILVIEKEMTDLQKIEQALAVIAKENMIDFINELFEQANRLIEVIWTVPFRIELLNPDNPLNYEFQVSGDNQSTREMSECSEGQTEILSLALNLALRVSLGHLNFPLCLDEPGRTFDEKHRQNLIFLLKRLLDDKVISQLFLVSHHATIHEAFSASETLVIREDNIMLPEKYNSHCVIT